jgi:hypothetical protein
LARVLQKKYPAIQSIEINSLEKCKGTPPMFGIAAQLAFRGGNPVRLKLWIRAFSFHGENYNETHMI